MVVALILLSLALLVALLALYRLRQLLAAKAPPVGGAAAVFAQWRDSGQMDAEEANVAMLAIRGAKRRARKAGR